MRVKLHWNGYIRYHVCERKGRRSMSSLLRKRGDFAALLEWDLWMWLRFVPELRRTNVWMLIRGLLRLVIWTRVWIFQELVLAKRVFFLSWNQTAQIKNFEKLDELLSSQYLRWHDIMDSETSLQLSGLAAELQLIFASKSNAPALPILSNPAISSTVLTVESTSLSLKSDVSESLPPSANPSTTTTSAQPSKIQQPTDSIPDITSSLDHQKNVESSKANTYS